MRSGVYWFRDFFLVFLPLLVYLVALGVNRWSVCDGTFSGSTGTVNVGLWEVCAHLSQSLYMDGSRDCRVGHCPTQGSFALGAVWGSHNLCDRSKVSAAFLIFAILAVLSLCWNTSVRRLRGIEEFRGWAILLHFLAVLFATISFGVWLGWQSSMNDDNGRNQGNIRFTKLKADAGVGLVIFGMVLNLVGVLVMWKFPASSHVADDMPPMRAQQPARGHRSITPRQPDYELSESMSRTKLTEETHA